MFKHTNFIATYIHAYILMIYICIVNWSVQSPLAISIYQPRCLGACCRRLHFHSVTCSSRFSVTPILEDHTLPQVQMLRPGLKKQSSGSSGSRDMSSHEFARRLGWFRHRFRIVSDNHRLRLSLSRLWMICRIVSSSGLWSLMSNHNDMLWYTMAIPCYSCKLQVPNMMIIYDICSESCWVLPGDVDFSQVMPLASGSWTKKMQLGGKTSWSVDGVDGLY